MTHITSAKTKKDLKVKAASYNEDGLFANTYFSDPSVFDPQSYTFHTLPVGKSITVTNHPKRTWFASISKLPSGKVQVK